MDRHTARIADRLAAPSGRQAALVKRMPGLVQDAHERAAEVTVLIASGDAHIVRRAAAEGMKADIEPAVFEIEAELPHQPDAAGALPLDRERAVRLPRRRRRRLAI